MKLLACFLLCGCGALPGHPTVTSVTIDDAGVTTCVRIRPKVLPDGAVTAVVESP